MTTFLCLILIVVPVLGQTRAKPALLEPCPLTIDQVPLVRGLRLGQPYDNLEKVLPQKRHLLGEKPDELGILRVYVLRSSVLAPERLEGVDSILLTYLDGSLSRIEIHYTRDVEWQSNLHFAAAIATQLNLPRVGWQQRDPSYLVCKGFFIRVAYGTVIPTLQIEETRLSLELEKRKAEAEERKRARFKP